MRRFVVRFLVPFLVLALAALPAAAHDLKGRKIGVVLLHGKWDEPNSRSLYKLDHALDSAGVLLEKPEMPWSKSRHYDASYDDAIAFYATCGFREVARQQGGILFQMLL